jgi:hypothetical protein
MNNLNKEVVDYGLGYKIKRLVNNKLENVGDLNGDDEEEEKKNEDDDQDKLDDQGDKEIFNHSNSNSKIRKALETSHQHSSV